MKELFAQTNKRFLLFFVFLSVFIGIFYTNPTIAMWTGFFLAAASAIGNDSIQTLGTFLTSNEKTSWWKLWMFIGGIFVAVMLYGWHTGDGAVDFGRLSKIEYTHSFHFLQVFAPAVLLLLTQFKIPVSTTFLILSVFATNKTIESMLAKTFIGYILAFVVAVAVWGLVSKYLRNWFEKEISATVHKRWRIAQWISTAFLWGSWLMQDTANIAVFLPRQLSVEQLAAACCIGFFMIGILLYWKGGPIQSIVREKKDVVEVRAATLIDLTLALILIYFKNINSIPMSTTWIFLGLLAGREVIMTHLHHGKERKDYRKTLGLVVKDIVFASIGILVSVGLVVLMRGV